MIRYIRRYGGFTRCAVSRLLAYRSATIMHVISSFVSLSVSLFLWNLLFTEQSAIGGYTFDAMITYAGVVFIINATMGYHTEMDISRKVLDGSIAADLTKPLNFQDKCAFEALGSAIVEFVIAGAAGTLIIVLLCGIPENITVTGFLLLFVSFILGIVLKFCISYIAGLMCFYTSNGYGVVYLRQAITDIFSGAMLPLSFYPLWFQGFANLLPFRSVVYTPTQLLLGKISGTDALRAILLQVFWVVALWLIGRLFFRRAVQKITVHGG